jgi:hypothetical protein
MEQKKDCFNLAEVASIFGQSVEAIKDKIFEGDFLTPSYYIKNPLRSGFYTEVQTQADKEKDDFGTIFRFVFRFRSVRMIPKRIYQKLSPCVITINKAHIFDSINSLSRRQQSPFNASFTGIVDILGIQDHRHSGEFDGKIQLHLNYGRRPSHNRLFRLRLILLTQSGLRVELDILEPREISEDKLIVRREYLINAIANDDEAMEHLEQLERLPVYVEPVETDALTDAFSDSFIADQQLAIGLRRDFYTPEQLAEYWRDGLGIEKVTVSFINHHTNEGNLKESLRYEWMDGRGWFFEDYPARTHMLDACKTPPIEKHYIRHQDAERFVSLHFRKTITKPIPEVSLNNDTNTPPLTVPSKGKNTAPITLLLEMFLSEPFASHSKTSFYEFVKSQLARKAAKKKDDFFTFPVRKIATGTSKGLYMEEAKAGKEGLSEQDFWYSDKDIGERLARAKITHKTIK